MFKSSKLGFQTISGFTLIELLVVMSIIAILSLISLFALQGARQSARDSLRKSDLQQIASGFEIYKSDCNYYPNALPGVGSQLNGNTAPCAVGASNVYMQARPDDVDSAKDYVYVPLPANCNTTNNCTGFRLWARLENAETLPSYCTSAPSCGTSGTCNYCIINP